ncbi:MAG: TonB C-terminal domain-containing protein [Sulfuricurvum sp.]|nr:TonB C-terminal domain-containing protein [Sulfuricurvum sp.]
MNLHYQRFFILSGVISFFILGLVVSFFSVKFLKSPEPNAFALTQSDVISVSLDQTTPSVAETTPSPVVQAPSDPLIEPKAQSVLQPPAAEEKPPVPEIDDLFSTVQTTKSRAKPKENTKQLSELNALEEKVLTSKRDSKLFEKVKTLDLAKSGVKMVAISSGPIVNEYNAKIQGIIYANFHPASGTEGFAARVRMTLSSDGKLLSYRVISYSGSAVFNAEVDWLKERLRQVVLPQHPQGEEAVFEIILTAKE